MTPPARPLNLPINWQWMIDEVREVAKRHRNLAFEADSLADEFVAGNLTPHGVAVLLNLIRRGGS